MCVGIQFFKTHLCFHQFHFYYQLLRALLCFIFLSGHSIAVINQQFSYVVKMHGRESARSLYSYISIFLPPMAFPGGSDSEECLQCRRPDFTSWVGKIPWRKEWQPTSVSLPGEFQGQRSLVRLLSMGLQRGGHD